MDLKKKITSASIACAVLLASVSSYAFDYDVRYDYSNQNIVISGTPDKRGDFLSLQIIKEGKSFDTAKDSDFLYTGQTTAKDSFEFDFDYEFSMGKYPARLATRASDEKKDFELLIVTRDDLKKLYNELNELSKTDVSAFKTKVNANIEFLTQDAGMRPVTDKKLDNFAEYVKENALNIEKSEENAKVLNTFLIIEDLNDEKIENISALLGKTVTDGKLLEDYKGLCNEDIIAEYFTKKISDKDIKSLDDYDKAFKEALILTAANYGSGYGELKRLVKEYGSDAITSSYQDTAYKEVFGESYSDINDLDKALAGVKVSSGAGGGGSSSGGKKDSNKNNMSIVTTNKNNNVEEYMNILFDDIDGVEWATVAIHSLADRGIINGKEPRKFAPNDSVTREEFVKILMGAMNMADAGYEKNNFTDVLDNAWYVSYVNIAYENKIVNGIGNSQFGVGSSITRQDMAVMLYNALKYKNADITTKTLEFADSDKIADYAKDAVSALFGMGAVNGVSATEFDPIGTATRAQAAKVIYGVINHLEEEDE